MGAYTHIPPTREYLIEAVREQGARHVYGPDWPHDDVATIALLHAYPRTYLVATGCDHHDADGKCLGHEL